MRYIGIQHRVKKTAEGEARPTIVSVVQDGHKPLQYKLETEQDEFDFLHGRFPTSLRDVAEGDNVLTFAEHHIIWRLSYFGCRTTCRRSGAHLHAQRRRLYH